MGAASGAGGATVENASEAGAVAVGIAVGVAGVGLGYAAGGNVGASSIAEIGSRVGGTTEGGEAAEQPVMKTASKARTITERPRWRDIAGEYPLLAIMAQPLAHQVSPPPVCMYFRWS